MDFCVYHTAVCTLLLWQEWKTWSVGFEEVVDLSLPIHACTLTVALAFVRISSSLLVRTCPLVFIVGIDVYFAIEEKTRSRIRFELIGPVIWYMELSEKMSFYRWIISKYWATWRRTTHLASTSLSAIRASYKKNVKFIFEFTLF